MGHGFTGAAHPVGAAIALENLKIIEERDLVTQANERGQYMQQELRGLSDHPLVGEVRGVGMIAAVELVTDKAAKTGGATPGALGAQANRMLEAKGVISRNMMDAMAFCPPLISSETDIDFMVSTLAKTLDEMHGSL